MCIFGSDSLIDWSPFGRNRDLFDERDDERSGVQQPKKVQNNGTIDPSGIIAYATPPNTPLPTYKD